MRITITLAVLLTLTFASDAKAQYAQFTDGHGHTSSNANGFGMGSSFGGGFGGSGFGGSGFAGSAFGGLGGFGSSTFAPGYANSTFGMPFGGTTYGAPVYPTYGLNPAPGVNSYSGVGLGRGAYYYNNGGMGVPSRGLGRLSTPLALGGGFYQLSVGGSPMGYWLAPSGYYYPWCPTTYMSRSIYSYTVPNQTIYGISSGHLSATKPPVDTVIADIGKFLGNARDNNQMDQTTFEGLSSRLNDLADQSAQLSQKNGGVLDSSDDANLRRQLDSLITDITRALNS